MATNTPTQEQLAAVRHNAFANSLKHLPAERQQRIAQSYARQDANRSRNVPAFVARIKGQP